MIHKNHHKTKSLKIVNNKAYYNYFIEKKFISGLVLEGWEVKSIKLGKINITESYIIDHLHEMYLCNAFIQPLNQTSTHVFCDPYRKKKLLLKKNEIIFLSLKKKDPVIH